MRALPGRFDPDRNAFSVGCAIDRAGSAAAMARGKYGRHAASKRAIAMIIASMIADQAAGQRAGFCQTETCERLSLVNGSRRQLAQRSRSCRPASAAIRSSSAGQT